MFRIRFNRFDLLVILIAASLSLLLILFPLLLSRSGATLTVSTPDGTEVYPLSVDRELEIHSRGITLRVKISGGVATVSESSCPDKVCMHSSSISHVGDSILCAPAGVRLTVTSERGGGDIVDFVAG